MTFWLLTSGLQTPIQHLTGMEGHQALTLKMGWHQLRRALKRDGALIEGEFVEARAVFTGEGLEMLQRTFFFKHCQIALQRVGRVVNASAPAAAFLARARMGR